MNTNTNNNTNIEHTTLAEDQDRESAYLDSGIISGEIADYTESGEHHTEPHTPDTPDTLDTDTDNKQEEEEEEYMRLDSGVLVDEFQDLDIVQEDIDKSHRNNLDLDEAQDTANPRDLNITIEESVHVPVEPWEIYFSQDDNGDTQLHIAIMQRLNEAVYALLHMCPNPALLNIRNDDGHAPIHLAVFTRQPHIVRRLLIAGAKVNTTDCDGNTAIHLACARGDEDCLRVLTTPLTVMQHNFGGNTIRSLPQALDQKNYDGEACVHLAAMRGHLKILKGLVWLGANINATENKSGRTVLHLAIEQNNTEMVHYLVKECQMVWLGARTYSGHTALQLIHGNLLEKRMKELFLEAGYNYQGEESDLESDEDNSEDEFDDVSFSRSNYFNNHMRLGEVNVA